ncbi:MAG: PepSY-associated TM helix domain-containing protein [Cyclobacteriaceae bacterium]
MKVKKYVRQLHLWVGLVLGALFFVIAFSGAVYTWAPEISTVLYKQKVEPSDQPFVSVSTLKTTLAEAFPEGDFRTVLYKDHSSAAEVLLYAPGTYYIAFLNPYTGELLHLQDMNAGWLNHLKSLHRNLMLGNVGRQIVHWGTLLFLLMMITGLVIWWPANKAGRKQRFTIKWGASPKRLNYDLHNVLGFYVTWISIFSVITGLFWGFEPVREVLRATTGENEVTYDTPTSDEQGAVATDHFDQFALLDSLSTVLQQQYPTRFIRISNPHKPAAPINVAISEPGMRVQTTDHYYFDRYTGKQVMGDFENGPHAESTLFHTMHGLVYDIHLGNVLAFPGRLLVCFASLIAASLPVTGFIVWFNKRKK